MTHLDTGEMRFPAKQVLTVGSQSHVAAIELVLATEIRKEVLFSYNYSSGTFCGGATRNSKLWEY